jgi:hypothetical protein
MFQSKEMVWDYNLHHFAGTSQLDDLQLSPHSSLQFTCSYRKLVFHQTAVLLKVLFYMEMLLHHLIPHLTFFSIPLFFSILFLLLFLFVFFVFLVLSYFILHHF